MKSFAPLIAAVYVAASSVFSQDTIVPKEYHFKEVVVTGIRTDWQIYETSRIREFIDDRLVGSIQQNQFVTMLNLATGIDIKDYGSAHSLKTLSVRGSSSEQVQILLNGAPIRSPASGMADIAMIPMDHVKLIEIDRGSGFSAHGHSAIGGTINLTTSPQYPFKSFYNEVLVALSSFDRRRIQWHNHWNISGWQTSSSFTKDFQPDSSYEVIDPYSKKKVFRIHTRSNRNSVTNQIHKKIRFHDLSLTNIYSTRQSQIPNTIENNTASLSKASQEDRLWVIQPQWQYRSRPMMNVRMTGSYQFTELKYRNPVTSIRSEIRTSDFYFNTETEQNWSVFYKTATGITTAFADGHGKMLKNADSRTFSIYQSHTALIPVYFLRVFDRLSLYPSARYDHNSEFDDRLTLQCGFVLGRYLDHTTYMLKGSAGNHFRAPTFNERYWNGDGAVGNSGIKPERSVSLNTGMTVIHKMENAGTVQAELNGFYNRTREKIVWESGVIQQGMISPVNLRKSRSAGWEFLTTYAWDSLTSRLSFVRNLSEDISGSKPKRIPYSPLYVFKFSAQWSTERWMFFQTTRYHSERFVSLQNTKYLKHYWITDLTIQLRTEWRETQVFIFANLNNIWDTAHEPVALYPGQARLFEIGIKIGY